MDGRVTDLLILAAPMLMLATLYACWRALNLYLTSVPAAATVWKDGYDEIDRQADFWGNFSGMGFLRNWNWRDGKGSRLIEDQIVFEDITGARHRATVERRVPRGYNPTGAYVIWYDPRDPRQVTAFGPGHWVMIAALFGAGVVVVLSLCATLART